MVRFGIDELIPARLRPLPQEEPIEHLVIRRKAEQLQRIVEGQNYEIRKTLWRYSSLVEKQRKMLHKRRMAMLIEEAEQEVCAMRVPERYGALRDCFGEEIVQRAERTITLHHIDQCWADHLAFVAHVQEGIHLVGIGGLNPLQEFHKQIAEAFWKLHQTIEDRTVETFVVVEITEEGIDLDAAGLRGPSSTWTYLINDRTLSDLQQMLLGHGNSAFAAGAVLTTWPLLVIWGGWQWLTKGRD